MGADSLNGITIRARAAYYLEFAERALAKMIAETAGYVEARSALDAAWWWVANKGIDGDSLYGHLENEEDTGLMVFAGGTRHSEGLASPWNVILTAMLYVTWQAYREQGEKHLPQTIEAVDESILSDLHRHAQKLKLLDEKSESEMRQMLLQRFPLRENLFGEGIARPSVMASDVQSADLKSESLQ